MLPVFFVLVAAAAAPPFSAPPAREWLVGPARGSSTFRTIGEAAAVAQPGDTVRVAAGVYRERVAPARGGAPGAAITYQGEPGAVVRGSEVVGMQRWAASSRVHGGSNNSSTFVVHQSSTTGLPFELIDGQPFNPFAVRLDAPGMEGDSTGTGSNCLHGHTLGQLFADGLLLREVGPARPAGSWHCPLRCPPRFPFPSAEDRGVCYDSQTYANASGGPCGSWCITSPGAGTGCGTDPNKLMCCGQNQSADCTTPGSECPQLAEPGTWMAIENGTAILAHFAPANSSSSGSGSGTAFPALVEATVRRTVFAPHRRGLGFITVRGFTLEHSANQWDDGFWIQRRQPNNPSPAAFAQAGLLSVRSGHNWLVENNRIRHANTIGIDIGDEGGYDPEGSQATPFRLGNHTVLGNLIELNGGKGIDGSFTSLGPDPYSSDVLITRLSQRQPCPECEVHRNFGGRIAHNVVRDNGQLHCEAAENAAIKTHGFSGVVEGNLVIANDHEKGMCKFCPVVLYQDLF